MFSKFIAVNDNSKKLIAHLDADCFYVSCERVRYKSLYNKPVGVLGNQGACVIAKSYEMKALGVKTGMPVWDAVKVCSEGIYIKRDFYWYEVLSKMMLAIVKSVSPLVEYYSVDEFFFDASYLQKIFKQDLESSVRCLQQRILKETGVPVSIGISHSKTLAKLASDAEKPFGCKALINKEYIGKYLAKKAVGELCGIGKKSAVKLNLYGIDNCLQLAKANKSLVKKILTKKGEDILWELNSFSINPILKFRLMHKNLARGGSLCGPIKEKRELKAWLIRNTERLIEALDSNQYTCKTITLCLKYKNFKNKKSCGWARGISFLKETHSSEVILPALEHLFSLADFKFSVTHMHVVAGELRLKGNEQLTLFNENVSNENDLLKKAVNSKFGRFTLRSADTLYLKETYNDHAQDYDICDIQGKTCF